MSNPASSTRKWLKKLQEDYREIVRESPFYEKLAVADSPRDLQWLRQMYYLSCDFTAAVALRYGHCHDLRFRQAFGEHAAEEVTHPQDLAAWMREFGFLAAGEEPTSVPPTLETLAYGGYFIRSAIREPVAHQIIVLNLMVEGLAYDWFSAMNPKLAELGLTPKGYWKVHQKADLKHQILGLDLIPPHEPDSPGGKAYARIAWEVASLARQELDAWAGVPAERRGKLPLPGELALI
ncbi:MAG TPA: iron-containing redox enzyme family protein [Methylococcaceae bacterium]|nr:iron-containing redox enzyme family protein [Methylococcaceae bacterium]